MQLLNLTLTCLLQELKPLIKESYINKLQELDSDKFKLKLRTSQGTKNLLLFPEAVFFSGYKIDARKQTSGFGAFLRKRIEGKKILSLEQHNSDRVIVFELQDYFLIVEFFAAKNIILTDKNFEIISALKKEEKRKIEKKQKYVFPESGKLNPNEMSFDEFAEKFDENFKEKNNAFVSVGDSAEIPSILIEEVFFRLKLKKEKLSEKETKKVFDEIKKMYSLEELNPIEIQKGKEKLILPFKLKSIKEFEEKDSVNSFLDEFYSKEFFSQKTPEKKPKKFIALQNSFEQQLSHKKTLEKEIEENRKKAELIYSNNLLIQEIIDSTKKGFSKGLKEKEIKEKINDYLKQNKKEIELISLTKNKVLLDFREN